MPGPIGVTLQALTPLWTGDANGQGRRIQETGILGSLRWWYEAIIRGLGRYACDPSGDPCIYDRELQLASICLVCQLFGCTGYGRRFRLVVDGDGDAGGLFEVRLPDPAIDDHRGWRIPARAAGPLTLTFRPLRPDALGPFEAAALRYALTLIELFGALGAKTSHGQGVVEVTTWRAWPPVMESTVWVHDVQARPAKEAQNPVSAPNLADFVGAVTWLHSGVTSASGWWRAIPLDGLSRFPETSRWIAAAPAVRAQLRGWLRSPGNVPGFAGLVRDRHRLMGIGGQQAKGSDIFVTHLYLLEERWEMRVFAFVPRHGNQVDQEMRKLLGDPAQLRAQIALALGLPSARSVRTNRYPVSAPRLLAAAVGEQL